MSIPSAVDLHDAYAADYDRQVREYGCHLTEVLFGLCFEAIQSGQHLLDAGIGSGLSANLFWKAGLQVYGFDFSPAMLEICKAKGIAMELKQHDIQQIPWPYPSEAFDHLVCCGVLHFISELDTLFDEASRLLRHGGLFAFTTKSPDLLDAPLQKHNRQTIDGLAVFAHSPEYLEILIERANFERAKVMRCFVGQDVFYVWSARKVS
jgi:predicted TPR repeat methyltransferase